MFSRMNTKLAMKYMRKRISKKKVEAKPQYVVPTKMEIMHLEGRGGTLNKHSNWFVFILQINKST